MRSPCDVSVMVIRALDGCLFAIGAHSEAVGIITWMTGESHKIEQLALPVERLGPVFIQKEALSQSPPDDGISKPSYPRYPAYPEGTMERNVYEVQNSRELRDAAQHLVTRAADMAK